MSQTMKAAVLVHPGEIRFEDRPIPAPGPDEALVRIRSVGVCGSDVHFYREGRIGSFVVRDPLVLGHESAGDVAEVGKNVKGLNAGDRVAVEPGWPCRKCAYCKRGDYHLCLDVVFLGTPPMDGTFVEYLLAPSDFVFPLPDNVDFDDGAMVEPMTVGVHACHQGKVRAGQTVAVLGAGPIGLSCLMAARGLGALAVLVTDVDEFRLDRARRLGAAATINVEKEDAVARVRELTGGHGPDVVLEAAGSVPATQSTIEMVRRGGTIVLVGFTTEPQVPVDLVSLMLKEAEIRAVFRYVNEYPLALALVASGKAPVKEMITHHYSFDQVQEALGSAGEAKKIKAVVDM